MLVAFTNFRIVFFLQEQYTITSSSNIALGHEKGRVVVLCFINNVLSGE